MKSKEDNKNENKDIHEKIGACVVIIGFCGLLFIIGKLMLRWFGIDGIITYCSIVAILIGIIIANTKGEDSNPYRCW